MTAANQIQRRNDTSDLPYSIPTARMYSFIIRVAPRLSTRRSFRDRNGQWGCQVPGGGWWVSGGGAQVSGSGWQVAGCGCPGDDQKLHHELISISIARFCCAVWSTVCIVALSSGLPWTGKVSSMSNTFCFHFGSCGMAWGRVFLDAHHRPKPQNSCLKS